MKVFLFGATSPTGQIVLKNLLEKEHQVTALVRNPEKNLFPQSENLKLAKGDVFKPESYAQILRGSEVVVSILGTGSKNKPTTIYSEGGNNILTAMRKAGVEKLITITSGGVQKDDPVIQNSFFYKYIGLWWLRHIYKDMAVWEKTLDQTTDIQWICIRPTYLADKADKPTYRVQEKFAPEKGWKISRTHLADFITKQLTETQFIHKKPVLAY
jgi:putative NADH-flavin reductase